MNIQLILSNKLSQAMIAVGAPVNSQPKVRRSTKEQFGDYQVNGVIGVAKSLRISPRELSKKVIEKLELNEIAYKVEIAGPGFINIFLSPQWIAKKIDYVLDAPKLGIATVKPQTIVVDYSSPNVAKEMHVGHMRSTIIGDATVRTLTFLGHNVIRANHIGDWGTQFGMLIAYLEKQQHESFKSIELSDLESFYCEAKRNYDEDPQFAKRARDYVVKLQRGNKYCRKMWQILVDLTMERNQTIYDRMNISLSSKDIMGESLYNNLLPSIVNDLKAKGIAIESKGATVVFLDEHKNKDGEPMGIIIQKKDGGYLYATTDIACAKYRYEVLKADRILYYVDSRQHQHLMQVWSILRKAHYIPDSLLLEHHMFGMMLGKDGKPFKTRTGGTIKLYKLLDEAVDRAKCLIKIKNPQMCTKSIKNLAEIIGIGAVKYADLSKSRTTDYIFNWDNMLQFEGNTAPYIQYSYTRVLSLFRKAGIDQNHPNITGPTRITEKRESTLAVCLLQFEEIITQVARDGTPHIMCGYLYELSSLFSNFYEHCSILNATDAISKNSRLRLALLTAKTIKQGLDTLGIKITKYM